MIWSMKESSASNYSMLSRYSFLMAMSGILAYFFLFPSGMYYSFFFGVMAVTGGIISRGFSERKGYSTAGIILGVFNVLLSLLAFYGLYALYSSIQDPVMGPKISSMLMQALEANGISLDTFIRVMG